MRDGTVIVLYNPGIKELENLSSNISKTDIAIVVDNSISDNYDKVKRYINIDNSKIYYKSFTENIGLCKALNYGIELLKNRGCGWALLLDADSKINDDIVAIYKDVIQKGKKENIAVLSPVHIFDRSNNRRYSGITEVKRSMTSGWYINLEVFYIEGCFFEPLFVDGLDYDYCYRVRKKGYKILECGNAIVYHNPGHTKEVIFFGKKIHVGIDSPLRYYMGARGEVWNLLSNKSIYDGMFYIYRIIKVIMFFDNKSEYLKQMIFGAKDGIRLFKKYKKACGLG